MGADIHNRCQKKVNDDWEDIALDIPEKYASNGYRQPFEYRNYGMFALFANVRNYSGIVPIDDPRGYPSDHDVPNENLSRHSASWLSISELTAISPDDFVEDRRNDEDAEAPLSVGTGEISTMRDFLDS